MLLGWLEAKTLSSTSNEPRLMLTDKTTVQNGATTELSVCYDKNRSRTILFNHLDAVLKLSREKMDKQTVADATKQKWCRILVSAVDAYGNLLKTDLESRVSVLETTQEVTVRIVDSVKFAKDMKDYDDALKQAVQLNLASAVATQKNGEVYDVETA